MFYPTFPMYETWQVSKLFSERCELFRTLQCTTRTLPSLITRQDNNNQSIATIVNASPSHFVVDSPELPSSFTRQDKITTRHSLGSLPLAPSFFETTIFAALSLICYSVVRSVWLLGLPFSIFRYVMIFTE